MISFRLAQIQTQEEHTENIGSPKVAIEPAYQARIQKAVDLINQHTPDLLRDVTDIVGHMTSGPFGQFSSTSPHTIFVNIPKIEQEVRSRLQGQPEDAIQQEVDNQIVKTITHESTHRKEFEQTGYSSESGPEAAEKATEQFLPTLQLQSSISYRHADILTKIFPPDNELTLFLEDADHHEDEEGVSTDDNFPHLAIVSSPQQASKIYRKWLDENMIGSEDAPKAFVYKNGKPYLRISYNGRLWNLNETEFEG